MDIHNTLVHLVNAGRKALKVSEELRKLGHNDSLYFELYGDIAEGMYSLIGEDTESFDKSVTYRLLNSNFIPDDQCAGELFAEYKKNKTEMTIDLPPITMSMLQDIAEERNSDVEKLVKLIISEWVVRTKVHDNIFSIAN